MKRFFTFALSLLATAVLMAQGWPSKYQGVMLQGFYWDSYSDTQWTNLESQADELAEFFNLIWIPQSGKSNNTANSMGYDDMWWFNDYNSSFGNEQELRSMISTFKDKGLGTIADVVINHRFSMEGWFGFPEETYKDVTYTMSSTDVCSTDDNGGAQAVADSLGVSLGAADSGDDFGGGRDLDHSSQNVQTVVKAYLGFLLNDLGYTGFRYDMVKGYAPMYTGIYNVAANPQFSVGEYWDGNASAVKGWLDGTASGGAIQSAAFDFPLKYLLNNCCNGSSNWNQLSGSSLMSDLNYRRYSVTFVDNHDTYRDNNALTGNVLAANAFILAAPGTPCVFLPHWKEYKSEIKQMIYARNMAGISNESTFKALNNSASQYAMQVNGDGGKSVVVLMGGTSWPRSTADEADYFLVQTGDNFAYYLSRNAETAWASVPSGTYDNAFTVTLNAVSAADGVQLVYTTDGSEPSASNGTTVADGATVTVSDGMTLKVALLKGGVVSGTVTRQYAVTHFQPYDITVYVNTDNVGWADMNYHSWGTQAEYSTDWPGKKIETTAEIGGKTWYYNTYRISSSSDMVNFVFSTGTGSPQTVDVVNVNTDKYFEISTEQSGGKYLVNDVTDRYPTGIDVVSPDTTKQPNNMNVYTIDGRLVRSCGAGVTAREVLHGLEKGIYIVGGKKVVKGK